MSIPFNKSAKVLVEPWYLVQVGNTQMMLTDDQAHDLFVSLNGLFGENSTLTERMDDLDSQVCTLQEQVAALQAAPPPESPLPQEPPTEAQTTIPPSVSTRDAVAARNGQRLVTLQEAQEIATAGNPYRSLGQGLTELGLAKLRELCQQGCSVREMAAVMDVPQGSVDFYLSKHNLRAERRFRVPDDREEAPDKEALPTPELAPARARSTPDEDARAHLASCGTPWREADTHLLRTTMQRGGTLSQAALLLKRSGGEVREQWVALCKERAGA